MLACSAPRLQVALARQQCAGIRVYACVSRGARMSVAAVGFKVTGICHESCCRYIKCVDVAAERAGRRAHHLCQSQRHPLVAPVRRIQNGNAGESRGAPSTCFATAPGPPVMLTTPAARICQSGHVDGAGCQCQCVRMALQGSVSVSIPVTAGIKAAFCCWASLWYHARRIAPCRRCT